jgi:hypothetical protein
MDRFLPELPAFILLSHCGISLCMKYDYKPMLTGSLVTTAEIVGG